MNYKNPIYTENGEIDCEIEHPVYGWIPFTASPNDCEVYGRELFERIKANDDVAPYVPPPPQPEPVPHSITPRQARLQLIAIDKFNDVQPAIDALPEPDKTIAQVEWEYATVYNRTHPFIEQLGAILEINLDEFFKEASKL